MSECSLYTHCVAMTKFIMQLAKILTYWEGVAEKVILFIVTNFIDIFKNGF